MPEELSLGAPAPKLSIREEKDPEPSVQLGDSRARRAFLLSTVTLYQGCPGEGLSTVCQPVPVLTPVWTSGGWKVFGDLARGSH